MAAAHNPKNRYGEKRKNDDVFVENSNFARHLIKKRIIQEKMLDYVCVECDQDENWKGKKLSLHLDHINGVNNDNRIENLRFLCPNCHSQTDTYAAKKNKGRLA